MYTTQVCPYCVRAKALLKQRGVEPSRRSASTSTRRSARHMMQRTGRRTVPQIFIGDTHVGGCDDLIALDQRGGLLPLLAA
jgi:glutaredoxin 3